MTKDLSCLLAKLLSTIKDGLVRYHNTKTSRSGVNNTWISKNSTSLLSSLDQLDFRTATSVQTFDFSTLYTSIPHDLLKSRIIASINCVDMPKMAVIPFQTIGTFQTKSQQPKNHNFRFWCWTLAITHLSADLFLYSYENEFLDNMIRSGDMRLVRSFNLCYRCTDDLIVFNNKTFLDYLKEIYPSQLTVEKLS